MGLIALIPLNPNKDGERLVENIVVAPDHVEHFSDGVKTLRPSMWFAPEGYEVVLLEEGQYVAIGYSYDKDSGEFTAPKPIQEEEQVSEPEVK